MVDPGEGEVVLSHQSPKSLKALSGHRGLLLYVVENRIYRINDDPIRPELPDKILKLIPLLTKPWRVVQIPREKPLWYFAKSQKGRHTENRIPHLGDPIL